MAGERSDAMENADDPLTVRFEKVGGWWRATVRTPDGVLVGTGPTEEMARDDLDWILMHRSERRRLEEAV